MTVPSRSGYLLVPFTVLGLSAAGAAYGASVATSLNMAPSVLYTDNVCLDDENKQGDWVARVTPGGSVRLKGKRANLNLSGFVEVNSLSNSQLGDCGGGGIRDEREQYAPNVRASGSVDLIRNYLKVSFAGRADQNTVNSRLGGVDDSLDRTGNTNNYYRYNVAPTFTTRVGSAASFNLQYNYDELLNEKNKANDSVRQTVNAGLQSRSSSQISWGLTGTHNELEYTNDDPGVIQRNKSDRQSARLLLGYRFGSRLSVNGTYGYDFNDLKTDNKYDQNGDAWSLSFLWTPNRRTSVSIGSGDRFFGKTPTLNVSHKRKRSSFKLGYDKRITYDRDIRTNSGGNSSDFGTVQSLQGRDPIIDERLTLGYNFDGNNIDFRLQGYHSNQLRTIDDSEGTFINLSLNITPVISSRFSLSYFVSWYQDEPDARFGQGDRDFSETWSAGVSYSKPINKRLNFGLTYQFSDRSSDQVFGDYQENRVEATLAIAL
ncbi:MAG: hypothetical protein ACI9NT_000359 [Bacteroidia bacterium]|jgi:hypothetical protein